VAGYRALMPIPEFVADLRRHIGHAPLWLPGVTAIVVKDADVLLVRRSDTLEWAPVTGIVEPGEHPATAAVREVAEETGVECQLLTLSSVSVTAPVVHANGDQAQYLDHAFRCAWLSGDPYAADDESVAAAWFPLSDLPPLKPELRQRIDIAVAGRQQTELVGSR
jgi:ADP-ribose pyrophosphatase YjhB (NUDIX family)